MDWEQQKAAMNEFERENAPKFAPLTPEQAAFERKIFKPGMDKYEADEVAGNTTFGTWEDVFAEREQEARNLAVFFEAVAMACAVIVDARDIPNTRENSILLSDALEAYEAWKKTQKGTRLERGEQ